MLAACDHPNIVNIHEFYQEPTRYCIVQELITGGELFEQLTKKGYHFSEKDAALVIKTILGAMNYCHQKGIVHRDLKPENILL